MDIKISRLNAINKLRNELEELSSPSYPWKLGESKFKKYDLFHRQSALVIKTVFGENHQYLRDWQEIVIPEDPDYMADDEESSSYFHSQGIAEDRLENQLEIMTKDVLTAKEGKKKKPTTNQKSNPEIFIVHGNNCKPAEELKMILHEVGIKPIILHEQPSKGMTIIEKLEEYSNVLFAFIILTPDDSGIGKYEFLDFLKKYFNKENASSVEIKEILNHLDINQTMSLDQQYSELHKDRARQNVILEFGYFIGRLGRRKVCCLYNGDLELPSDMHGICYLNFNGTVDEVKDTILEELRAANIIH